MVAIEIPNSIPRMSLKMLFASQLNLRLILFGTLLACTPGFARADLQPDVKMFDRQVKPLLQKYCGRCHGEDTAEAKIRFDNIDPDLITGEHFGQWEDVREAFHNG